MAMTPMAGAMPLPLAGVSGVDFDPAKTHIEFTLPATGHTVRGSFRLLRGVVRIDDATTGRLSGEIIIDAGSADSGNHLRDTKMKNDVLETRRFPEIRFIPQRLEGQQKADGTFDAVIGGVLELHGGTHAVSVNLHGRRGDGEVTGSADLHVPYVAWGLRDPSVLFLRVAKEVDVHVSGTARVVTAPPHSAPFER